MAFKTSDQIEDWNEKMNAAADAAFRREHPTYEAMMPHVNQMIQSKFIGTADLPVPQVVTIRGVVLEKMRRDSSDQSWIMYFNEQAKGLKLNNTILRYLEENMGANSDGWIGKRVRIYVDHNVEFGGKKVGGVRIQASRRGAQATHALYQSAGGALQAGEAAPRFDPMTGRPLAAPAPAGARFDPMTGKPLGSEPLSAPEDDFDRATGEVFGTHPNAPGQPDPDFDDEIPF